MEKEIKKTKNFDITPFETLNSNGNTLLKGGFSAVYNERFAFGGKKATSIVIVNNQVSGCDCIIIDVNAACPSPPKPPILV